jgi:xanthine dehydrogenase accessory factor
VKHWQELDQILDRMLHLARSGRPTALATVTHIQGSAYRRPGARLLIEDQGAVLGGVSGGCLEEDVRQVGLRTLQSGLSRLLHYETGDDETKVWGLGLGCDGTVDIAVQPFGAEAALRTWAPVRALLQGDAPFALVTVAEDDGPGHRVALGESGAVAGLHTEGTRAVFTEVLQPPPELLVCGAGDDARPLVTFAAAVGFRVTVVDPRAAYLTRERFPDARALLLLRPDEDGVGLLLGPRTHAVVMSHSLKRDSEWVRRLVEAELPYVGVLGPRARTERMMAGLAPAARERIFGPVGLDLGADGPEQVALSILAELLAVCSGREPRHLRERAVAVHAY